MMIGILFLVPKLQPLLLKAQIVLFPLLTLSAIIAAPTVATAPFNVVTLNIGLWIASIIALLLTKELPTARFCKRKRGA